MVAISPYSQKTDQGLGKGFLMESIPYTPYRGVKGGGGEWPVFCGESLSSIELLAVFDDGIGRVVFRGFEVLNQRALVAANRCHLGK